MISSVGSSAASQLLSTLLSKLASASSASSTSSASSSMTSTVSAFQQAIPGDNCTGSSSSGVSTLSGDVLEALIALQAQSGASTSTATNTSTASSSDPLQQLFSAMDSDGNGEVSQSEMESYIEGAGGTQGQADALYASLDQSGSGVTESDMSSAISQAQQSQQAWRGHHHHHHYDASGQADQAANTLLQALDSNNDGSVSESEFTSFMTANGVSSTDAQNDFTALDSSGSGSLTSADFAKAWQAYTSQSSGTILASFLGAMAQTGSTTSISA